MASGFSFSSETRYASTTLLKGHRSIVFVLLATCLLGVCGFRLVQLQLVDGIQHRQRAEQNRLRLIPITADRGNILDRNGKLLSANRLTRSVYLWPREQSPMQWQKTANLIAPHLGTTPAEILKKLSETGYHSGMPVRISRDLTPTAFVAISEQAGQLQGLEIRAESNRYYPHGKLASHVLGYVGEASLETLKANPKFPMGMIVGQMGVERLADEQLRGTWGDRLVEVDARGQELRMLGTNPPEAGSAVQLTLDVDLQKAAEKALGSRRGAVVALNVKTGGVLVLASGPSFDPNLFTRNITQAEWNQLQGPEKPFLNRALQGYPPASTFKIVTSVAGIESGKYTPSSTIATAPFISFGGIQFWEHSNSGYGVIGFKEALTVSSNTFYYQMGLAAGPEQISKWGKRLGIGTTDNMGLEGGSHGLIPTPEEKEELYGEPWYGGDTVSMAIGQGLVQVTPLEMAVMVATVANGGKLVKPHLFAHETNTPATQPEKSGISPGALAVIRDGLVAVVKEGTGRQLNDGVIPLTAGKTGTAEVPGQVSNALYVGYGPVDDPQIALAVIVENGGYGGVSAVPIAHEIYRAYFKKPALDAQPK